MVAYAPTYLNPRALLKNFVAYDTPNILSFCPTILFVPHLVKVSIINEARFGSLRVNYIAHRMWGQLIATAGRLHILHVMKGRLYGRQESPELGFLLIAPEKYHCAQLGGILDTPRLDANFYKCTQ